MLALALADPGDRVPVECSVSEKAGHVSQGTNEVTAVQCDGRSGFFVPSARYRELSRTDQLYPLALEEVSLLKEQKLELKGAIVSLTLTASASEALIRNQREIIDMERTARFAAEERSERSWYEHPGVWFAVGAVAVVATGIALANWIPDRLLLAK
jgi:hypothetical protein